MDNTIIIHLKCSDDGKDIWVLLENYRAELCMFTGYLSRSWLKAAHHINSIISVHNTVAEFMSARYNETVGVYMWVVWQNIMCMMGDILVAVSVAFARGMHYYEYVKVWTL